MSRIPASFICPITQDIMKEPVIDREGNTYEKSAIEEWLISNNTSPITRNPLILSDLSINRSLKNAIEDYKNDSSTEPASELASEDIHHECVLQPKPKKLKITHFTRENLDMVNIKLDDGQRIPIKLICVIDVSGSMGSSLPSLASGKSEDTGLSILDGVKHCLRTIVASMNDIDSLVLIKFSTDAELIFEGKMNRLGKENAETIIDRLKPENQTNIYKGIVTALNYIKENPTPNQLDYTFVLTDGVENLPPPRGTEFMIKKWWHDNPVIKCPIYTFGFGYSLNSKQLEELARFPSENYIFTGTYTFIPDSSILGTAFIHAISNIFAKPYQNVVLTSSEGIIKSLGPIQFGQKYNFMVPNSNPETTYKITFCNSINKPLEIELESTMNTGQDYSKLTICNLRYQLIESLEKIINYSDINHFDLANEELQKVITIIQEKLSEPLKVKNQEYLKNILEDLNGQVKEAISSSNYYERWGKHYLPSLKNAHELKECNNFKDPGIQEYGGDLFKEIRDSVDAMFIKLPPPKPSIVQPVYGGGTRGSVTLNNMRGYLDRSGGCVRGDCLVTKSDGSMIMLKEVKKGDMLIGANGNIVKLICLVENIGNWSLVNIDNELYITEWHPIREDKEWFFPNKLIKNGFSKKEDYDGSVYSFITEDQYGKYGSGLMFGKYEAIGLAHGIIDDKVANHEYYGTVKVIKDLKEKDIQGWECGKITLSNMKIEYVASI